MSGPAPKHPDRRQRPKRGTAPRLQIVPSAGNALSDIPPAPKGLLKQTRTQWEVYWRSPMAEVLQAETDMPAVYRMFSMYDERERAYRAYKKDRLVVGSQGQKVLNPLARQMARLDAEIRQLEDRLGLTPKARAQLGITIGQAKKTLEDLNRELGADDE